MRKRSLRALLLLASASVLVSVEARGQSTELNYEQARSAFSSVSTENRILLQVLLTATGYWNAVPNETFGRRLFNAIQRFQSENGFPATGVMDEVQIKKLAADGVGWLATWGFAKVAHPARPVSIWVPLGLGLNADRNADGVHYSDPSKRIDLTFTSVANVGIADNYRAVVALVERDGARIHYKVIKNGWYVISMTDRDGVDHYFRYHQDRANVTGFTLAWNNANGVVHGERIAILMSASLWSDMTGAAFVDPLTTRARTDARAGTGPAPTPSDPPERTGTTSGTGFFVTADGSILTNEHVVDGCTRIYAKRNADAFVEARLVASDKSNDLALLKIDARAGPVAALRIGAKLGEDVAVFGYPLAPILSTSGNFTRGSITALAGLRDDTRHFQISAPVQPGNSGGPLLDAYGNVIGVVVSKLNATKIAEASGDIPQNVNFAVKASAAAMFLETNQIAFDTGTGTTVLPPVDIADRAKELSVYIECR